MLKMIDENYKTTPFRFGKKGVVAYGFKSSIPVSIRQVKHDATQRVGGMVSGAVVGDVLLGPVGLLAGAMMGGKSGTIYFVLRLLDGREIACHSKPKEYQQAAVRVNRYFDEIRRQQWQANKLRSLEASGKLRICFSGGTIALSILLGTFWAFRCGVGYGIIACLLTLMTCGLAWPFVTFAAISICNRKRSNALVEARQLENVNLDALKGERQANFKSEFGLSA
jgi:hypothetical protein